MYLASLAAQIVTLSTYLQRGMTSTTRGEGVRQRKNVTTKKTCSKEQALKTSKGWALTLERLASTYLRMFR